MTTSKKGNEVYLVVLSNSEDRHITLVPEVVFNWIQGEQLTEQELDAVAEFLVEEEEEEEAIKAEVRDKSKDDNDRALMLPSGFNTYKELIDHIQEYDFKIMNEYDGFIY